MNYFEIFWRRLFSETPKFFKKIIVFGIGLGTIGASILVSPIELPAWLLDQADNLIMIGAVAALIAKSTTTDTYLSQKK